MRYSNRQYGDDRYLVYHFEDGDTVETMSFGQITNNTIAGLAPATLTQMDSTISITYTITSLVSLDDFLRKPIKKKQLLGILSGIIKAVRSAQEYMIDQDVLMLDRKLMFLNPETMEMSLICVPAVNAEGAGRGLQEFLWELAARSVKDKSENREYVSELIEKLNPDDMLSLNDMDSIVAEFDYQDPVKIPDDWGFSGDSNPDSGNDSGETPESDGEEKENPGTVLEVRNGDGWGSDGDQGGNVVEIDSDEDDDDLAPDDEEPEEDAEPAPNFWNRLFKRREGRGRGKKGAMPVEEDEGEDIFDDAGNLGGGMESEPDQYDDPGNATVLEVKRTGGNGGNGGNYQNQTPGENGQLVGNETVLEVRGNGVPANVQMNAHLIRENTGEIVYIKGTIFQIGSDYEYSDYHISDNRSVADTHARIILHRNEYYIKDINSKNHTYVDGKVIPGMVEVKLNHGSKVRLGTESFVFELY